MRTTPTEPAGPGVQDLAVVRLKIKSSIFAPSKYFRLNCDFIWLYELIVTRNQLVELGLNPASAELVSRQQWHCCAVSVQCR